MLGQKATYTQFFQESLRTWPPESCLSTLALAVAALMSPGRGGGVLKSGLPMSLHTAPLLCSGTMGPLGKAETQDRLC